MIGKGVRMFVKTVNLLGILKDNLKGIHWMLQDTDFLFKLIGMPCLKYFGESSSTSLNLQSNIVH